MKMYLKRLLRIVVRLVVVVVLQVGGVVYLSRGAVVWEILDGLRIWAGEVWVFLFRYRFLVGGLVAAGLGCLGWRGLRWIGFLRRGDGRFVLNRHCTIYDPYRHALVVGSSGCGKTVSVIEPFLREAVRMGHAGLVYDYKSPTLEKRVRHDYGKDLRTGVRPRLLTLNMADGRYSHRFDLLSTVHTPLHARELASTIISAGGTIQGRSPDFFTHAEVERAYRRILSEAEALIDRMAKRDTGSASPSTRPSEKQEEGREKQDLGLATTSSEYQGE